MGVRLMLMRHAKSSWDDPQLKDKDRPLNARGLRSAERVGAILCQNEAADWIPDVILCSDAVRAQSTLEHMVLANPGLRSVPTSVFPELYSRSGSGADIVDVLQKLLPKTADNGNGTAHSKCALLIGHNPGWEESAAWLCGDDALRLKTAHAALLQSDADGWADALNGGAGTWALVGMLTVKSRKKKTRAGVDFED
uniref:Phosphoglycerate mutase n=1 Tax=Prasinoderma coloniale TaxID=156133 RepID=A0A7R9TUD6_9VIRI|mmetsp:Transcript_6761/g.27609  ORF Transcript_6761/g.27609 Transcript_6761/m.27609 type:complete len:196 (+) Transcript_6761:297-884(+)|eukprot:PRCOL_00006376-RA